MLDRYLDLSNGLRPGFGAGLGRSSEQRWRSELGARVTKFPSFLRDIYSSVEGTDPDAPDQLMADFVPGFRLIHLSELLAETDAARKIYSGAGQVFPFLANYSSDYYAWFDGRIVALVHDDPLVLTMHESGARFFETICAYYDEGAYLLDDGFLEVDEHLELSIGARINPGLDFWLD
jgi:hypothetical protein